MDREGTIKILDMGLARVVEEETVPLGATLAERLTVQGEMLGTVDYISPEQGTGKIADSTTNSIDLATPRQSTL